ncbi:glycosyltransferase family 2 protein [Paenibacillus luteus]|uniref:glycosyltransferase family 2 protein n=1 Tax=Paenibacillus luteus TaxID=2545753 RepID=UPI001142D741|nr:glycosyltransferase family 2 protein [Paenibacillus luteus]
MELDIIIVTYNSESWVEKCVDSISRCRFPKEKLNLIFVDNASSDSTISKIEQEIVNYESSFGSIQLVQNKKNVGFGRANNIGVKKGKSDYIFFLNIDTELLEDSILNASIVIEQSDKNIAAWEFRQFPYEHPKNYDPVTLSISWISGAAFIIRRAVFAEVNGFDKAIFMYAEDVDLSWRIRSKGYNLIYMPQCIVYHYSYKEANEIKPNQFTHSLMNNLNLKVRYGSLRHVVIWHMKFSYMVLQGNPNHGLRRNLVSAYIRNLSMTPFFYSRSLKKLKPTFVGWDYEEERTGGFYNNFVQHDYKPLVSILIRSIGRTKILKEALTSVRNQTYKNIEVIVVEDGGNESEKLIKEDFHDLNIVFFSTKDKVGRSRAANIALDMANGEFLNFLDDDDLLFPDHVEVLVNELSRHPISVIYSVAFEVPTEYLADESTLNHEYKVVFNSKFNRLKLFYQNYLPIQCVMFKKDLVRDKIYFDENMDALEDWDFWMRLSLDNDFLLVDKTTSLYRVPYHKTQVENRQKVLDNAIAYVREKQKNYFSNMNGYDVSMNIMDLIEHSQTSSLKNKHKILYSLYKILLKMIKTLKKI